MKTDKRSSVLAAVLSAVLGKWTQMHTLHTCVGWQVWKRGISFQWPLHYVRFDCWTKKKKAAFITTTYGSRTTTTTTNVIHVNFWHVSRVHCDRSLTILFYLPLRVSDDKSHTAQQTQTRITSWIQPSRLAERAVEKKNKRKKKKKKIRIRQNKGKQSARQF